MKPSTRQAFNSIYAYTEAGMAEDITAALAGVKGATVVYEHSGSFSVALAYRWWVCLTFGWYRRRAMRVANEIIRSRHTAGGVLFRGVREADRPRRIDGFEALETRLRYGVILGLGPGGSKEFVAYGRAKASEGRGEGLLIMGMISAILFALWPWIEAAWGILVVELTW